MKLAAIFFLGLGMAMAQAGEKLAVASLSTVLTDIAGNVGGDKVEITNIIKPGIDPHGFEPTPGDIKAISKARVVLVSGLGFEGYLDKLRTAVGSGPIFVVVGEAIKPIMTEDDHDHDHDHAHVHGKDGKVADPHWWHSVANAKIATRVIRDAFVRADPADAATFEGNARAYMGRLDELSKWMKLEVAKLPKNKRTLVTSHDALGYFARDNGFEIHPVQGISTSEQPSSKKVRDLIGKIKAERVKAIFAENIENPKVLSEITKETGAKLGGTLYADGLGKNEAKTYDAMMRHNVTTVVGALQ